ncbi:MAG: tetratricopeptide repeat protein [Pseudomonadota bacterium]
MAAELPSLPRLRAALVPLAALLLAACAPLAPGPGAPVDDRPGTAPAPPVAAPPPAEPRLPPSPPPAPRPAPQPVAPAAVAALVAEARSAATAGRHETAAALAERAQRLDPRAPEPYLVLARAHQARGRTAQARQFALKGISASRPGTRVRAELESLLRQLAP